MAIIALKMKIASTQIDETKKITNIKHLSNRGQKKSGIMANNPLEFSPNSHPSFLINKTPA